MTIKRTETTPDVAPAEEQAEQETDSSGERAEKKANPVRGMDGRWSRKLLEAEGSAG